MVRLGNALTWMLLPNPLKNTGISGPLGTREAPRDDKRITGGLYEGVCGESSYEIPIYVEDEEWSLLSTNLASLRDTRGCLWRSPCIFLRSGQSMLSSRPGSNKFNF